MPLLMMLLNTLQKIPLHLERSVGSFHSLLFFLLSHYIPRSTNTIKSVLQFQDRLILPHVVKEHWFNFLSMCLIRSYSKLVYKKASYHRFLRYYRLISIFFFATVHAC